MQTITSVSSSRTGDAKPLVEVFPAKTTRFIRIFPISAWKKTSLSRALGSFVRIIGDYRLYRRKGFNPKVAWHLANIPDPAPWEF